MKKYLDIFRSKKVLLILLLLIIVVVVVSMFNKGNLFFVTTNDSYKFADEYESLNDKKTADGKEYSKVNIGANNIKYITIEETLDILENGTAAIYIGYAECLYCRSAVQVLVDAAKEKDLENIYYLDISKVWDIKELNENGEIITKTEAHEQYNKLLEELGDEYIENYILTSKTGEEVDTGVKRVKVPLVIFVVNGNIVSSNVGTLFSQEDPYQPLDDSQVQGLKEIYQYGIRDVLEGLGKQ